MLKKRGRDPEIIQRAKVATSLANLSSILKAHMVEKN